MSNQHPEGFWAKPGAGHSPSYIMTVWQIIFLAELGADKTDARVRKGCDYFLEHYPASNGGFGMNRKPAPSNVVHCLNGDPLFALIRLGYENDERVHKAMDWQVQAIIGNKQFQYFKSGTCDSGFACAYNQGQPCAWGATKALKALSEIPEGSRSPAVKQAIGQTVEFLLSKDLSIADYPFTERVNSSWFNFGFPLSYRSDILESFSILAGLGYSGKTKLKNAFDLILKNRITRGGGLWKNHSVGKCGWISRKRKNRANG